MQPPTFHIVNVTPPIADVEEGNIGTVQPADVVNCQGGGVSFIYITGANATGNSTLTILACDNVTPSNTTAVPFVYRTCVATDIWSDWTAATAAGFNTGTVANSMYHLYVDGAELAEEGYGYVRCTSVEVTDAAVTGGIIAIVHNMRYQPITTTLVT